MILTFLSHVNIMYHPVLINLTIFFTTVFLIMNYVILDALIKVHRINIVENPRTLMICIWVKGTRLPHYTHGTCIILLNFITETSACEIRRDAPDLCTPSPLEKNLNPNKKDVNLKFKKLFYVKLINISMKKKHENFY